MFTLYLVALAIMIYPLFFKTRNYYLILRSTVCSVAYLLVHGQVTIIFVVSVGLSVCLFVCVFFFSAVFDPILIKLGHMLYVWV